MWQKVYFHQSIYDDYEYRFLFHLYIHKERAYRCFDRKQVYVRRFAEVIVNQHRDRRFTAADQYFQKTAIIRK